MVKISGLRFNIIQRFLIEIFNFFGDNNIWSFIIPANCGYPLYAHSQNHNGFLSSFLLGAAVRSFILPAVGLLSRSKCANVLGLCACWPCPASTQTVLCLCLRLSQNNGITQRETINISHLILGHSTSIVVSKVI